MSVVSGDPEATISAGGKAQPPSRRTVNIFGPLDGSGSIYPESIESAEAFGTPTILTGTGLQLFVNNVQIVPKGTAAAELRVNTFNITSELASRSTCKFHIYDINGTYTSQTGQPVVAYHGTKRIFGGIIQSLDQRHIMSPTALTVLEFSCSDFAAITERRLIASAKSYPAGSSLSSIVSDIITNYLDGEGIVLESAVSSVTPTEEFKIETGNVKSAFDKLANYFQVEWRIDYFKILRFGTFSGTYAAPVTLADNQSQWLADTLVVNQNLLDYVNTAVVQSSQAVATNLTETTTGDGSSRTFSTAQVITAEPTITVNGYDQRVTTSDDLTGGWDFYWTDGQRGVVQNPSNTVLSASDTLVITYQNPSPNTIVAQNAAEVAARQAIEDGSGIWGRVVSAGDLSAEANVTAFGTGYLDRHAEVPKNIRFETDIAGWEVGQTLTSTVTTPSIATATFLITQVTIRDVDSTIVRYGIVGTTAPKRPNSFRSVLQAAVTNINQSNYNATNHSGSTIEQGFGEVRFFLAVDIPGLTNPGLQVGQSFGNPGIVRASDDNAKACYDVAAAFEDAATGTPIIFDLKTSGGTRQKLIQSVDVANNRLLFSGHRLLNGETVTLTTTGVMPGGLTAATTYYIVDRRDDDFKVATEEDGTAIDITSAGSGDLTATIPRASLFGTNLPVYPVNITSTQIYYITGSVRNRDLVTVDIYQVGSGEPGANGSIVLRHAR